LFEAFRRHGFKIGQGHFEGLGDTKWNKMIPNLIIWSVWALGLRWGGAGVPLGPRDLDQVAATK
jgi:hypothetical protein